MLGKLIGRFFLWLIGWKTEGHRPAHIKKYVVVVAPHTSNWDFVLGVWVRPVVGLASTRFIAKAELFRSPIGKLFYWLGGTPVDRSQKNRLVEQVAEKFNHHEEFGVAITPEGTRSYAPEWKTGFYHIAQKAGVPILVGYFDYHRRVGGVSDQVVYPSGDLEGDLASLREICRKVIPRHPSQSALAHELPARPRWWVNPFSTTLRALLVVGLLWVLFNLPLVLYGLRMGYHQLRVIWQARPVAEYLANPDFPEADKEKLRLIAHIRAFSVEQMGMDPSGSYQTFYDQQGKPLLWVLTANPAFSLEPYAWDFPVLGATTYKGFFDSLEAAREEQRLQALGYDTDVGEVNAWSTLGILNDPVLSSMLERNEGSLANLILHELAHGTIFVRSDIAFNENIASFIGDEGARWFLKEHFGDSSAQLQRYMGAKTDRHLFGSYILSCATRLDSLYATFPAEIPASERPRYQALKQELIRQCISGLDTVPFQNPRYREYFKDFTPNNTFFTGYRRYRQQQSQFAQSFEEEFGRDLRAFIAHWKQAHPSVFAIFR